MRVASPGTEDRVDLHTLLDKGGLKSFADAQAQQAMKEGDVAKAVEVYQSALTDHPGDADLSAKCSAMIGDIKALADGAWREKDFARAGAIKSFLLRVYPSFDGLRPPLAFSEEGLKKSIADCRESLTKKGLAEYRRGNLAEAVAVWEGLLAFDPDNAEIKKAVTTARTQLDAIKKKKLGLRPPRRPAGIAGLFADSRRDPDSRRPVRRLVPLADPGGRVGRR